MPPLSSPEPDPIPPFLHGYEDIWRQSSPREAARAWFKNARFGLFLHYGVYSLLGRGEWVMFRERIPVREYEKLKNRFTAADFDARFIADLALDAGMKYITITSRHHDSFCLFRTAATDFNSVNSPAGRDLMAEMAEACAERGLGLFFYYSYALDWRHPYFFPVERGCPPARPHYDTPDPHYKFKEDKDFRKYIDFVHAQLRELLTQYGPVAGIWFDPIMGYYYCPELFPIHETYALIRSLQPHCLIAFKTGATGDEDFASPEHTAAGLAERIRRNGGPAHAVETARRAWDGNKNNPRNEICTTLTTRHWGYSAEPDVQHRTPDDVMKMLAEAEAAHCNLLLNTGPLPGGGIDPTDEATLREVGRRIRRNGFPAPAKPAPDKPPAPRNGPAAV